jgi:hypothetical protein
MKATAKVLIIVCLICSMMPLGASHAEAEGPWEVRTYPASAFSGDNVSFMIMGVPGAYAFVQVSLDGTPAFDTSTVLDAFGTANVSYQLPPDLPSGVYLVQVFYHGSPAGNASLEVVFDDMAYMHYRVNQMMKDNAKLTDRVVAYAELSQQTKAEYDRMELLFFAAIGVIISICLVMFFVLKPYIEWRAVNNMRKGHAAGVFRLIVKPPVEGDHSRYIDGARSEIVESRKRRAGAEPAEAQVTVQQPETVAAPEPAKMEPKMPLPVRVQKVVRVEARAKPPPEPPKPAFKVPDYSPENRSLEELMRDPAFAARYSRAAQKAVGETAKEIDEMTEPPGKATEPEPEAALEPKEPRRILRKKPGAKAKKKGARA